MVTVETFSGRSSGAPVVSLSICTSRCPLANGGAAVATATCSTPGSVARRRSSHAVGHHADDRRRLSIHAESAADDVCIGAIAVFPEAIAEEGDWLGAGVVVGRREVTADERLLPQYGEDVGSDRCSSDLLRRARSPLMFDVVFRNAARPLKVRLRARQSSKSG